MHEDETLRILHKLQLMITDQVKSICEINNIEFFMIGGTMLGAIRHKGFIPWDDDVDLGMLRKDYEKFISCCENSLDKSKFYLQTDFNDTYYAFDFAKIRLKGTSVTESFSENVNTNQGIYIDIFPLDNLPDNKWKARYTLFRFWIYRNLLWVKCGYGEKERKKKLSYKAARILASFISIDNLKKKKNNTITKYSDIKTNYVINSDGAYGLKKEIIKREWVENIIPYTFEDRVYPGVSNYRDYLTHFYNDYMELPPENQRNHHARQSIDFGSYC